MLLQTLSTTETLLKPRISNFILKTLAQFISKLETTSLSEENSVGHIVSKS